MLDGGARFEVNQTLSLGVPVVVKSGEVYVGGTLEKKEVLTLEKPVTQGVSDVFVKTGIDRGLIVSGNPTNSSIYTSLTNNGGDMPKNPYPPLTRSEVLTLKTCINSP